MRGTKSITWKAKDLLRVYFKYCQDSKYIFYSEC